MLFEAQDDCNVFSSHTILFETVIETP